MLFALLGKYNPMMLKTVTNKENEIFTNPPEGIEVVARYSMVGERGGFINIVNTTSAESLGTLLSKAPCARKAFRTPFADLLFT